MAGIGDSWGTREELLHPRDAKGRFRSKWKMSPAVLSAVERALSGFQPRTFQSDSQAAQFLFNESSAKKPGRFGGGDGFARLQADYNAADEDLRDGIVDEPSTKKFIQMMDEAMIEIPDGLIISRVVGPDAFGLTPERLPELEEMTGNVIADRGYGAANIGTPLGGGQGMVTMVLATPKGTKMAIPGRNRNDRGVFYDRDQEFTVTKVKPDGRGGYTMYAVATPRTPGDTPPMEGVGPQGEGRSHDREEAVRRLQEMNDKRLTGEQAPDQISGQSQAPVPVGDGSTPGIAPPVDDETSRATRRAQILGRPAGPNATPAAQQGAEAPPAPTAPPVPEAPAANVPEAPSAVTPPPGATSVVTGEPATSFRDAVGTANLDAPSAGPRRREWNSAYQGVVSGKQQPADMLRELESDISNNKLQQKTETGRGDSVLAKDIEDQEKLADLIRSHFNLGEPKQRQARQEVRSELATKAASKAQKAMLRKPGGTEKAPAGKKTAAEAARPGPMAKVAAPRKDTPADRAKALVQQQSQDATDDELNAAQRGRWADLAGGEPASMKKNDTAGNILLDEVADLLRNGRTTRPKASARLRDQARDDTGPEADYLRKVADAIDADTSAPAKRVPVKKVAKAAPDVAEATKKLNGRTDKNILTGLNGLSVGELRALADDWGVGTRGDDKKLKLKAALAKELAAKWKSSPDLKKRTGAPEAPAAPAKKVAKAATKAAAPAAPKVGTPKTERAVRAERRATEAAKPETPAQKQTRLDVQKLAGDLDERNAREQASWDKAAADTRAGWDEAVGAPPADLDPLLSTGLTIVAGGLANKKISKPEAIRRLEAGEANHPAGDPYGDYIRKLVAHLRTPTPRKSQSKKAVLERLADEPEAPAIVKKAAAKAAKKTATPAAPVAPTKALDSLAPAKKAAKKVTAAEVRTDVEETRGPAGVSVEDRVAAHLLARLKPDVRERVLADMPEKDRNLVLDTAQRVADEKTRVKAKGIDLDQVLGDANVTVPDTNLAKLEYEKLRRQLLRGQLDSPQGARAAVKKKLTDTDSLLRQARANADNPDLASGSRQSSRDLIPELEKHRAWLQAVSDGINPKGPDAAPEVTPKKAMEVIHVADPEGVLANTSVDELKAQAKAAGLPVSEGAVTKNEVLTDIAVQMARRQKAGLDPLPEPPAPAKKAVKRAATPGAQDTVGRLNDAKTLEEGQEALQGLGRNKKPYQDIADAVGVEYRPTTTVAKLKEDILRQAVTGRLEAGGIQRAAKPVTSVPGDASVGEVLKRAAKATASTPEARAKKRRVTTMATRLHKDWQGTQELLPDGTRKPKPKPTTDEAWKAKHGSDTVDIANTPYAGLPDDWQKENRDAADVVDNILQRNGGKVDLNDPAVVAQVGEEIHGKWLERHGEEDWVKGKELDKPFSELTPEEQAKDIDQLRIAMGQKAPKPAAAKKVASKAAPAVSPDEAMQRDMTVLSRGGFRDSEPPPVPAKKAMPVKKASTALTSNLSSFSEPELRGISRNKSLGAPQREAATAELARRGLSVSDATPSPTAAKQVAKKAAVKKVVQENLSPLSTEELSKVVTSPEFSDRQKATVADEVDRRLAAKAAERVVPSTVPAIKKATKKATKAAPPEILSANEERARNTGWKVSTASGVATHTTGLGHVIEFKPSAEREKAAFRAYRGNNGGAADFTSLTEAKKWVKGWDGVTPGEEVYGPPTAAKKLPTPSPVDAAVEARRIRNEVAEEVAAPAKKAAKKATKAAPAGKHSREELMDGPLSDIVDLEQELGLKRPSLDRNDRVNAILEAEAAAPPVKKAVKKAAKAATPTAAAPAAPAPAKKAATGGGLVRRRNLPQSGGKLQKVERVNADEPLHLPNGGSDQGFIHMDSDIGQMWQDLVMDERVPNSFVNEIARMGDEMGRNNLPLAKVLERLKAMEAEAPDSSVAARIRETVDNLSAPEVKLDLPDDTPPRLRRAFEELAAIPTARKKATKAEGHERMGPQTVPAESIVEKKQKLLKQLAEGDGQISFGEFENLLGKHDYHESVDSATTMWHIMDQAINDKAVSAWIRQKLKEARARAKEG